MERASEQGGVLASANVCGDCDDEQDDSYPSFDSSLPRLLGRVSETKWELLIAERFNQLGTHKGGAAPPPPPPPPLPPQHVALGMFSAHLLLLLQLCRGFSNASVPARVSTNGAATTHPYPHYSGARRWVARASRHRWRSHVSGSLAYNNGPNDSQPQTVIAPT